MSPNARRRYIKIVAPPKPKPNPLVPNKNKELVGGLKNALERGESIEKAKKSFTNAGYKRDKVDILTEEIAKTTIPVEKASTQIQSTPSITTTISPAKKQQISKKFLIILAIVGILALVIAGFIGLFWNKIF